MVEWEDTYFEDLLEIAPYVDDFLQLSSDEETESESGKSLKVEASRLKTFPPLTCFYVITDHDLPMLADLSDVESSCPQIGGADLAPVKIHGDSVILDQHMVEVSPRFGVRVGVFRFVPSSDELAWAVPERQCIHAVKRIFNVYQRISLY